MSQSNAASCPTLATELFEEIIGHFEDDDTTLLSLGLACKDLMLLTRPRAFDDIVFKDDNAIIQFDDLRSSEHSTIKARASFRRVQVDTWTFIKMLRDSQNPNSSHIRDILSSIAITHTLAIHSPAGGGISRKMIQAIPVHWRNSVRHLEITGGTHHGGSLFSLFSALPQLESLWLGNIRLRQWKHDFAAYAFPEAVTTVSLVNSPDLCSFVHKRCWLFGITHIRDIYLDADFDPRNENPFPMQYALQLPTHAQNIQSLTFHPTYPDLWECNTLQAPWFAYLQKLEVVRINLVDVHCGPALSFLEACITLSSVADTRFKVVDISLPALPKGMPTATYLQFADRVIEQKALSFVSPGELEWPLFDIILRGLPQGENLDRHIQLPMARKGAIRSPLWNATGRAC
ncbi:hypothetical protein FA13DRAFT_510741 [Coprinellus micaceus]|uniref:F-box domain-containing protein n=1 Tax=Coprinellus micaceus TaxID=71717 RepID=A0A4Y7SB92_COPMI|nr:hypothetical protein FA13DRAFT_510741 [Coprinellus micaceus]